MDADRPVRNFQGAGAKHRNTHLGHLDLLLRDSWCLNGLGHLHTLARVCGHHIDDGDRLGDGDRSTLACRTQFKIHQENQMGSTGRDHQSDMLQVATLRCRGALNKYCSNWKLL